MIEPTTTAATATTPVTEPTVQADSSGAARQQKATYTRADGRHASLELTTSQHPVATREVESDAIKRWKEIGDFVVKMSPRAGEKSLNMIMPPVGQTNEQASKQKTSGPTNPPVTTGGWLEARDPSHRYILGNQVALNEWETAKTDKSLFEWLDGNPEKQIEWSVFDKVESFSAKELPSIKYFSPSEASQLKASVKESVWSYPDGSLIDTSESPGKPGKEGYSVIVQTRSMKDLELEAGIYVHPSKRFELHHDSVTHGRPVQSAGLIKIDQGKAVHIDLFSGHYRPGPKQLDNLLSSLETNMDLSQLKVTAPHMQSGELEDLQKKFGFMAPEK